MTLRTTPPTQLTSIQNFDKDLSNSDVQDLNFADITSFSEKLGLLNIFIPGRTEKSTPHNDDWMLVVDTEDGNSLKKAKKSNVKIDYNSVSGLVGWYDPNDSSTITNGTGSKVATIADKTSESDDLTEATDGNRPTLETAVVNGRDVLRFDRTNSTRLRKTSFSSGDQSQPQTIFVVVKPDTDTSDHRTIIDGGENDSTKRNLIRCVDTTGNYQIFAGTIQDSGVAADSGFVYLRSEFNTTNGKLFRNGTQIGSTSDIGSRVMSGMTLGAAYNNNDYSSCDIGLVLRYNKILSASEISIIEGKIQTDFDL